MSGSSTRTRPKAERPETLREARRWQTVMSHYLRRGLCHTCASQAAWGHQIGFSRLEHDPCRDCAPIVATFAVQTAHTSWRRGQDSRNEQGGHSTPAHGLASGITAATA